MPRRYHGSVEAVSRQKIERLQGRLTDSSRPIHQILQQLGPRGCFLGKRGLKRGETGVHSGFVSIRFDSSRSPVGRFSDCSLHQVLQWLLGQPYGLLQRKHLIN